MPVFKPQNYYDWEKYYYIEKLKNMFPEYSSIKTPLGMLLESLGVTREKLKEFVTPEPSRVTEQIPYLPQIQKSIGGAITGMVPYETDLQNMVLGMMGQIKAYHGSPYKFSKFENKAIGTGEGAQAFGYGHYLSESPEVAKNYATSKDAVVSWGSIMDKLPDIKGKRLQDILLKASQGKVEGPDAKIIKEILEGKYGEIPSGPHIYEATIHKGKQPSEYTYLEWDKPIEKQSEVVKKISQLVDEQYEKMKDFYTADYKHEYDTIKNAIKNPKLHQVDGAGMYHALAKFFGGEKTASERLFQSGISGIKYPTGSLSGIKGSKEYNYVVFNPEDITIENVK